MKRISILLVFFLVFPAVCGLVFSRQLSKNEEWIEKLVKIEQSKEALDFKIGRLEELLSSYQGLAKVTDGICAKIIHRLGDYYAKTGDYEKGIGLTKQAVRLNRDPATAHRDESFLANSYFNLGAFYGDLHLYQDFNRYIDSCISIAKQYPDKGYIGLNAFEKKALVFFERGDNYSSIDIANQGLIFSRDLPLNKYVALLHLQKAQAFLGMGMTEAAIPAIEEAFEILPQVGHTENDLAVAYSVHALCLKEQEDVANAVSYYEQAIEINIRNGDEATAIKNLCNIGNLYDQNKAGSHKALESYSKGLDMLKGVKDPLLLAILYNNIGTVHLTNKKFSEALSYFQNGLTELSINFTDKDWQSNPSVEQIRTANNNSTLFSLLSNKGKTLLDRYRTEADSSYLSLALDCFKLTDKSVDFMRWNQSNENSKYFWREKTRSMYENAIETCFQVQDMENALYFFEKSRAVMLNDKLSELGSSQFLSQEDQELERKFKGMTVALQQKLEKMAPTDPGYSDLVKDRYEYKDAHEKFIKSLEDKYPSYYTYKYDTSFLSLDDLRSKVLQENQTFVSYFNGENYLYALKIDADSASLKKINKGLYEEHASQLVALSSERSRLNQNYPEYQRLAHTLYGQIYRPLNVGTRRVIISPDDHFLPFELLLTDKNRPQSFLLQDHAFSYTYSAGYLLKNRHESGTVGPSLLGVAPVNYQPHLQQTALQGADHSLNALQSHFSSSKLFIGEQATKGEFIKNLPGYAIVQLYSHAEADMGEREPTVYFYDSALKVSDLQLLGDLPTKLVVLSACNTGVGKNIKGEGMFSLARGFAAAGIPSSITSLWQIDNRSTYQITELFYKYLGEGRPLDIALQEAKLEFLRTQDKSYDLPYFWAGSILLGNADGFLPERGNYIYSLPHLIGLISIAIIISSWIYRKKYRRKRPALQGS